MAGLALGTAAFGLLQAAPAAADVVHNVRIILAPGGVALSGYDPVSYFTHGAPLRGKANYALKWRGTIWYFSSAENMAAFEMNPKAFMPAFGGHCAASLAKGELVAADPEYFFIEKGRLYLSRSAQLRDSWGADHAGMVTAAASAWAAIRQKLQASRPQP